MTDRPIIFSGPMVQALLTGRKNQTRRILKPQPPKNARYTGIHFASDEPDSWFFNSPNGPSKARRAHEAGDHLWVRESGYQLGNAADECRERDGYEACGFRYAADGAAIYLPGMHPGHDYERRRPSIHMPRWASRLTLLVTDVRVERLQDISEEDARAEGAEWAKVGSGSFLRLREEWRFGDVASGPSARSAFTDLWNSIHGPDAWAANPWVAVITFRTIHANIDSVEAQAA